MDGFEAVHAALRQIMMRAIARDQVVTDDTPGNFVVRTASIDPGTGEPGWFGTVVTRKSYVAYHLMPLYTIPELADNLSPALARRRQGKTCFNFKKVDEALFTELAMLTERARDA